MGETLYSTNPLRDPADRRLPRIPEPCALVIFGVTGDLAKKKLIPAVYDLANRGPPPGVVRDRRLRPPRLGRRDVRGDGPRGRQVPRAHPVARGGLGPARRQLQVRARRVRRRRGLRPLDATVDELRDTHGIVGNAAFYFSIPPLAFPTVLKQLKRTGMSDNRQDGGGWRRVVVEKPFGEDRKSASELNDLVDTVFTAPDVFRIDHYLGKETVQNIFALRFANAIFEPIWNSNYVDHVQITMAEDVGIGSRAGFYDDNGAARDVLQNHVLQLLAIAAMEQPNGFEAEEIRTEKLKVLRAIKLHDDLEATAIRGQYADGWVQGRPVQGYLSEDNIPQTSTTETYAAVQIGIQNRRWNGVPFYLRTGKRLPKRVTEIAVVFKEAPHMPFADYDTKTLGNNQLVIRVQPDEGITVKFGSKVPGTGMELRDISMGFGYGETFTESSPEAYERLILDVLLGDKTLFPDAQEVDASWAVVDPLEEYWASTKPEPYESGTWGPSGADLMLQSSGRRWRRA